MEEDGTLLDEVRVQNANLYLFAAEYAESHAAIEATSSYRHVYNSLDEHLEVTLVNPSKTRAIPEAKSKTNQVDAKMLAHLLRYNMLPKRYVPPNDIREFRISFGLGSS